MRRIVSGDEPEGGVEKVCGLTGRVLTDLQQLRRGYGL
jgi:hypothetical protein